MKNTIYFLKIVSFLMVLSFRTEEFNWGLRFECTPMEARVLGGDENQNQNIFLHTFFVSKVFIYRNLIGEALFLEALREPFRF